MKKKFTLFIEPKLHKQIKLKAVGEGIPMNDLIIKAVKMYLERG